MYKTFTYRFGGKLRFISVWRIEPCVAKRPFNALCDCVTDVAVVIAAIPLLIYQIQNAFVLFAFSFLLLLYPNVCAVEIDVKTRDVHSLPSTTPSMDRWIGICNTLRGISWIEFARNANAIMEMYTERIAHQFFVKFFSKPSQPDPPLYLLITRGFSKLSMGSYAAASKF
uniref:Uncharacterized protein n=1 Tax=Glossina brevipalpis TaxID=37001 RepID=A0A1A9W670_9MUSC